MANVITHLTPETTAQELFHRVMWHLVQQNKQSVDSDGTCRYRRRSRYTVYMCAVGALIPDKFYMKKLEYHSARSLIIRQLVRLGSAKSRVDLDEKAFWETLEKHKVLLMALQDVHDTFKGQLTDRSFRQHVLKHGAKVALNFNLVFNEELYLTP